MSELLVKRDLISDDAGHVEIFTLNRPDQLNPLDHRTVLELGEALATVDSHVGAVIITGAGRAFSAGGDLKGYQDLYRCPRAFAAFLDDFAAVCDRLETGPFVSIAMINGTCVAGGLELVLSCDLAIMSSSATIGDAHLQFAQLPGAGGSQRLVRAIGMSRARSWMLTGAQYAATDAFTAGLVSEVTSPEDLRNRTIELSREISSFSPLAVSQVKALLRIAGSTEFTEGLAAERRLVHEYATTSSDAWEGLNAFIERRSPRYTGS